MSKSVTVVTVLHCCGPSSAAVMLRMLVKRRANAGRLRLNATMFLEILWVEGETGDRWRFLERYERVRRVLAFETIEMWTRHISINLTKTYPSRSKRSTFKTGIERH